MLMPVTPTRDYIFSYIKKLRMHPDKVTPERKFLTMETPFMEAYVKLLIHTCHKRGAHAMGGMAAQIPVKNNPKLAAQALESVKKDKVSVAKTTRSYYTQCLRVSRVSYFLQNLSPDFV